MGAFGFLYMDGVSPNLGLQDQICALEWVQNNISDFGGDPANVTIFAESAAATSVAYLLVMPSAKGLFHKAILESGAFPFESLADNQRFAETGTRKLFKELSVPIGNLPALQKIPLAEIMRAEKKVAGRLLFNDRAFYPVIDGTVIPEDVYGALYAGCANDIPVIIGVNAEKLLLFGIMFKPGLMETIVKYSFLSKLKKLGATSKQINALLTLDRGSLSSEEVAVHSEYYHLISDEFFRVPATLFAEAKQAAGPEIFFYCFSHPALKMGVASHVMELYLLFGTITTTDVADMMVVPGTDDEVHLSQAMMTAWTSFTRFGNPNHSAMPEWPSYELEHCATMYFDFQSRVVTLPFDDIRSAWMSIVNSSILR